MLINALVHGWSSPTRSWAQKTEWRCSRLPCSINPGYGTEGLWVQVTGLWSALLFRNNLTDISFLRGSPGGTSGKEPTSHSRDSLWSLGQEDPLCCCCLVAQSCPTLYDPMDCSTPGFPVLHHLPEFAQAHVHRVTAAIQPSHPLSSPSPPALFPNYWSFCISPCNEYSGLISFSISFSLISLLFKGFSVFSSITVWRHQFFGTQPFFIV